MKYDFSRCDNLQFKAKNEKGPMTGYLRVTKEGSVFIYTDCAYNESFDSSLQLETRDHEYRVDIEDFSEWAEDHELEIIPRDPETYTDWKVGDRIKFKGLEATYEIAAKLGDVMFLLRDNGRVVTTTTTTLTERVVLVLTDYEQELLAQEKEKCPFEKDDKVLVRDRDTYWRFDVFGYYYDEENARYPYVCKGSEYELCIPLNEHTWQLLGTMEEYKEE